MANVTSVVLGISAEPGMPLAGVEPPDTAGISSFLPVPRVLSGTVPASRSLFLSHPDRYLATLHKAALNTVADLHAFVRRRVRP